MCPCRTVRSEPRTVGVSPAQDASLRAEAHRGDVADLGQQDQRGERADAGQPGQGLDPRVTPGVAADLGIEPAGDRFQGAGQRQGVGDHLRRDGGQLQRGEPFPARPAPVPGRPVVAVVGQHGVDPVLQQVRSRTSCARCRSSARSWPHLRRRDPRLGQQVGAQQLRQDRGAGPCRSSAAPTRWPCTAAGAPGAARNRSPREALLAIPSRTRPRTLSGCLAAGRRSPARSASRRCSRCGWRAPGHRDR